MKRVIGIVEKDNAQLFLLQENGSLSIKGSDEIVQPANYHLIKNRDNTISGDEPVKGDTVFNFRYGPVTGGTAEAGIYNIYTNGEKILSVNIDISYKKRNIEKKVIGNSPAEALKYIESICGNFLFSHSNAFTRAIEKILQINPPLNVKTLRVIALELERVYNHFYVIANLASGAAQKVFTSQMFYLFEEILRINKIFSGHRHLKNFNHIGNVNFSENCDIEYIHKKLSFIKDKFQYLYEKSLESGNYLDRLHNTGIITKEHALEIGLTGPSLRASGIREDLREFDPVYTLIDIPVKEEGDALSRMEVRAEEALKSIDIIMENLKKLNNIKKDIKNEIEIDLKDSAGTAFEGVESPSGTLAYYLSVENNRITNIYAVTPSLFGFKAIADSLAGQIFTDFVFTVESFGVNFADAAR